VTVLFVSYSGLYGGSERMLLDVASGFEEPAAVACPEGPLAQRARELGLRVFPVRERRLELRATLRDRLATPARLAGLAGEVREIVSALSPDVVYGWGARGAIASLAALRTVPAQPAVVFQNNDLLKGPWVARVVRAAARLADRVITPSEAIARDIDPRGGLGNRREKILHGVDLERFTPDGHEQGQPRALVLGAIVAWKGPRLALDAAALALRDLPELEVTIAGPVIDPGRGIEASIARRAELPDLAGHVTMPGEVDAAQALRRSTCLLHCADCEPYGLVLVEALASGLPVIAPDSCGPAEIVDAGCGRLYPPGDARAAADALVEVLGAPDRVRELGEGGRRRAEEVFDVADTQRRHRELVSRLGHAEPAPHPSRGVPGEGIALVTVTHNSEGDLSRLLASVERHLPGAGVVVVDCASDDASAAAARAWPGGATVIALGENAGFGRACNAGIEAVEEPVTVLANPDAELLDGSLALLADELRRPGRGRRILAPLVLRPDGGREDSAQREPGSLASALAAFVPPAGLPAALPRLIEPWRAQRPRRAGWAVGACLAARTEVLRELGPFDERIFLYGEDLDLGLRAADAGVETWFWPEGRVLHRRGHSAGPAFGGEPFELLARTRRAVIGERRGEARARLDDALQALTFASRAALKTLLGRPSERERRQLSALREARREPARLQPRQATPDRALR
jgi:N-acetylglucosaminyl-diphospho-decaprenol L-rhamnosyltransferase